MSVFKKKATVKTFFFELTNISKLWWHVISKTQEFDKFTEKWINYLQKSANYTDICFLIRYLISDIGYLQKICKIYIILICKRYPLYDYLLLFYRYRYTTPIYLLSVICKKTNIVCFLLGWLWFSILSFNFNFSLNFWSQISVSSFSFKFQFKSD